MQLNSKKHISAALTAATCGLLTGAGNASAESEWKFDTALFTYSEQDRINVIKPIVNATKDLGENRTANVKLVVDVITGSSANGATPSNVAQTFTSPSGNTTYVTGAGETPVNSTFKDTRVALSGNYSAPLERMVQGDIGGFVSWERDFLSLGGNTGLAFDFNNRNTTLSIGAGVEFDTISPAGNVPVELSNTAVKTISGETKNRTVVDGLIGLTQVLSRTTVMRLNYSYSYGNGYHTDPYKIVSRVNSITGATVDYIYEKRPDKRGKNALFWQIKHHLSRDIVDFSYRYMTDDWGVKSHTADISYRVMMPQGRYFEPHVRYYTQTAAHFYRHSIFSGVPPAYVSADYRLAERQAFTIGAKFGMKVNDDEDLSIRLEYYSQSGSNTPSTAVGLQRNLELAPSVRAIMAQIIYSF